MGGFLKSAGAFALAVVLCFSGAAGVRAQVADDQSSGQTEARKNKVFQLGEVEVFGNALEDKNTTVDRIFSEEMLLLDANNVATALNLEPGVTLTMTGQRNEEEIYMRGFNIRDIPIFLDGVPIYDTYFGYPPLAEFTTYGLSEMVVSKGFTSVLYGPNTMGGAINLVTMKPQKEFEVNGGSGYGSGNSYHGFANFGSNQGKWYFEGGGSYENQDYFNLPDSFGATKLPGSSPVAYQEPGRRINSGFDDWIAHGKIGLTPNATDEYALSFMRLEETKGSPPYAGTDPHNSASFWIWPDWDFQDVHFNSKTSICNDSYVKTTAFYDTYDNSINSYNNVNYNTIIPTKGSIFQSSYGDYSYGASMEAGTKLIPYNSIKAAFHFKDDVHTEWETIGFPSPYGKERDEDRIYSLGLEDTIDFTKRMYAIAGVSYDWMSTLEVETTHEPVPLTSYNSWNPQLGLFYKLTDTGTIHASVEDKSRLPTLQERYSYSLKGGEPNPFLRPEKATNYEVGYKDLLFGKLNVEATAFYDNVHDYIISVSTNDIYTISPLQYYTQNQNVGHVDLSGIELGCKGEILPNLKGGMNYTYLQYINVENPTLITGLPHNKVFAYLQYFMPVKGWSMLGSVEYDTDRYSDASYAPAVATAYTLVNFKTIYKFPEQCFSGLGAPFPLHVQLEAGINNIFDQLWELSEGYPEAGRTFFVQMRFNY